ncbi:hypothetical protein FACS1894199_15550 [Bacteroidia bacterium]|nr:hypothetical protein FACS1894199_15550 [Bacteroidia bacterium]
MIALFTDNTNFATLKKATMQKKTVQTKNITPTKSSTQPKLKELKGKPEKRSLLARIEIFLTKKGYWSLILCLVAMTIGSLLTFDVKISEGLDDSDYIQAGFNYAQNFFGYYYGVKPPLYCMMLAIPIAIFGLNLVAVKVMSLLFALAGITLFYFAFRRRVAAYILVPSLLITTINTSILYFTSQAYTEMFVVMIISLFCYAVFRLEDAVLKSPIDNYNKEYYKNLGKQLLFFGFVAFLYYLSRALAYAAIMAAAVYFVLRKKQWVSIATIISFAIFYILYNKVIQPFCWGDITARNVVAAFSSFLTKDAYNPALGTEDFWGIVTRFFANLKIYTSAFFGMLYLKTEGEPSHIYSVLLIALMLVGFIYAWIREQHAIVFSTLLVAFLLGATFIVMHASWGQGRMILIYMPLILIVVFYGFAELLKIKRLQWLQWVYVVCIGLILLPNIKQTVEEVNKKLPVLRQNMAGNKYFGYTPDWVNYFLMSEWAAKNCPKDAGIACRKAPMSFVYTHGRKFQGIGNVPTVLTDSALQASNYKQHFVGSTANNVLLVLQPHMVAILIVDTRIYTTYDVPDAIYAQLSGLDPKEYSLHFDPQEMLDLVRKEEKKDYGVYPDALLNSLKKGNVSYVIDASLRANPTQKTENIITTIRRFLYFVEYKYPGIFRKIQQIGKDDAEPAMLYEVVYPVNQ